MKKNWIKQAIGIFLLVFFCVVIFVGFKNHEKKNANEKYYKLSSSLTLQVDQAEKELKALEEVLELKDDLEQWQLAKIHRWIAHIYLFQFDFERMLQNSELASLYAGIEKRDDILYWVYIDIANMFMMINYNDLSVKVLEYAEVTLKHIENKEEREIGEDYLHYYYAWAYRGLGSGEELIEHISYDFKYMENYSQVFYITRHLFKAIGLYNTGDYQGAKELLPMIEQLKAKIEGEEHTPERSVNLECPLMRLKAMLYLADGNINKAFEEAQKLVEYGKEHYTENEILYFFIEFLEKIYKIEEQLTPEQKEIVHTFEKEQSEKLPVELFKARRESGDFILDSYFSTVANLMQSDEIRRLQNNVIKSILLFMAITSFLLYIVTSLRRRNRKDGLTGVYNRAYFNQLYEKYKHKKGNYYYLLLDIDHFKNINDTFGHEFGDEVLIELSKCIKGMLTAEDYLFRYGGEEFCIIAKRHKDQQMKEFAEKVRKGIEGMIWRHDVKVTISIGVSKFSEGNYTIALADERLYESKRSGRNKVSTW